MLTNVNKPQNVDACLHFLPSKGLLTQVGMHCKSNQSGDGRVGAQPLGAKCVTNRNTF